MRTRPITLTVAALLVGAAFVLPGHVDGFDDGFDDSLAVEVEGLEADVPAWFQHPDEAELAQSQNDADLELVAKGWIAEDAKEWLMALGGYTPAPSAEAPAECLETWQDWSRPKWFFFKEWAHGIAPSGASVRDAAWELREINIKAYGPGHVSFRAGRTLDKHSPCDPDAD